MRLCVPFAVLTQAVAAMAWGTASCPKVDKIAGPGNQYVTAAKMLLQNSEAMVAIDMPAGPSEVCVTAQQSTLHTAGHALQHAVGRVVGGSIRGVKGRPGW